MNSRMEMPSNRSMILRLLSVCVAILFVGASLPAQTQTQQSSANLQMLEKEITRLAEGSGGKVGVAAMHLETWRSVTLNGSEAFPMASTFKVPVAVQYFTLLDQKNVSLETMVTLTAADMEKGEEGMGRR